MSNPSPKNISASIHAKLTNRAGELKLDPNILRTRYALERFLYRLSLSRYNSRFTLKGAMLFVLWSHENFRPTKDADFLLAGEAGVDAVETMVREICVVPVEQDDAMHYSPESVKAEMIKEDQAYGGVRVSLTGRLGKIPVPVQLDIGTGDVVIRKSEHVPFSVIIEEFPSPMLSVYSRESVVAEKLEAMVKLDLANSRMKDFYYDENKNIQWRAFLKKGKVVYGHLSLQQVCTEISESLNKVFRNIND